MKKNNLFFFVRLFLAYVNFDTYYCGKLNVMSGAFWIICLLLFLVIPIVIVKVVDHWIDRWKR